MDHLTVFTWENASQLVTWLFFVLCVWGMLNFIPSKNGPKNPGAGWLVFAIWLGFLGNGMNVLYWRIFGDLAVTYEWVSVYQLREFGNGMGDVIWKGTAMIAVYLHFYARWKAIPKEHQADWSPLLMGLYPDGEHWLIRSLRWTSFRRILFKRKQK